MNLKDNIKSISGIGESTFQNLQKLGIEKIEDLLYFLPKYYKDSSTIGSLSTLDRDAKKTVTATLTELKNVRTRSGKFIQIGKLYDQEAVIEVMWFNQTFLTRTLKPPVELILSGKLNPKSTKPQLISPEYQIVDPTQNYKLHIGSIVPVYPLTKGITVKWLRNKIKSLLDSLDKFEDFNDNLPDEIKLKYGLIGLEDSLRLIHFPNSQEDIISARKRLGFDELLEIQRKLLKEKEENQKHNSYPIKINSKSVKSVLNELPFKLTETQEKAVKTIHEDISQDVPMRRLLQGDVGSGKTIVALLSLLPVIESGYQTVLLAPTSILASQHYKSIQKLLPKKFKTGLITSATKEKPKDLNLIIGTHAVLAHKEVLINQLGLLIIDEQHRFGVKQRRDLLKLSTDNKKPHLLQLTATPIPRTVALSLFGDYQISKILPPSTRKKVKSYLINENKRADSYSWIKQKVDEGGQVFWILPVIEENENMKSINDFFPELKKEFKKYKLRQLHGKIKSEEKDKILKDFASKKIDILVSTSVVEVGIDIPGANVIVIESSERFGLAQLHQLRGRVGRNNQESWCLLYYNEKSQEAKNRLSFFAQENDGNKIALFDLERRGPGEVYGTVQSGIPELKVARFSNIHQLQETREVAIELYKK